MKKLLIPFLLLVGCREELLNIQVISEVQICIPGQCLVRFKNSTARLERVETYDTDKVVPGAIVCEMRTPILDKYYWTLCEN